jgi:hypothetical protein
MEDPRGRETLTGSGYDQSFGRTWALVRFSRICTGSPPSTFTGRFQ